MKQIIYGFVLIILILSCQSAIKTNKKFRSQEMLDYAVKKTRLSMNTLSSADSLPRNIYPEQTQWNKVGIHDWTSGFWPGILWYAYEASGDTAFRAKAKVFTEPLRGVLEIPVDNHDLGFMLYCSFGNGYRLTPKKSYRDILLRAADSLATLYNPKVGTILSWPAMRKKMGWPHNTIIDNMINLELLFWASKNGGSHDLYDIAVRHAETCMHTLVRPDHSTFHVAVFDTIDGHFIKGVTHQGYSDNSMWSRGQSWGIYGYTMCYRETKKKEFIDIAQKLTDKFLNRLPQDGIPYWDFDDPAIPNASKDASAAAIAASAILELSTFMSDKTLKSKYKNAAIRLLSLLSSDKYLSKNKNQAFLMHSTGHHPNNSEIDVSIIYADYYYLEALLRLKKFYDIQAD